MTKKTTKEAFDFTELDENGYYAIILQDKPGRDKDTVFTEHQVLKETYCNFFTRLKDLHWKRVSFGTKEGEWARGYLNGLKGDFSKIKLKK